MLGGGGEWWWAWNIAGQVAVQRQHACLRPRVIGNQLSGKIGAHAPPDIRSRGAANAAMFVALQCARRIRSTKCLTRCRCASTHQPLQMLSDVSTTSHSACVFIDSACSVSGHSTTMSLLMMVRMKHIEQTIACC